MFRLSSILLVILLHLIELHCEDLEININVKLSDLEQTTNSSSSRIISVLIKHERKNVSINCTATTPNITTTILTTPNPTTAWPTTVEQNTTSTWSTNNITWTTEWIVSNHTNGSWWLDWWFQRTTTESLLQTSNAPVTNGV